MLHQREFIPQCIPGGGDGGSSFAVLPFSVPVVVLLSLLVTEVCESLLGNPSLTKEKGQINTIKHRQICSVRFFYTSWVALCEGRISEETIWLHFAKPIRVNISLFYPNRNRKEHFGIFGTWFFPRFQLVRCSPAVAVSCTSTLSRSRTHNQTESEEHRFCLWLFMTLSLTI